MKKNIIQTTVTILAAFSLGAFALQADSFDFKDPKGVNNVSFSLDAPLESISGTANGITGTVEFDPEHPEKTSGEIVLATETLMVANSMMRDHMLGGNWMDVENYPTITFTARKLKDVKKDGNSVKGTAVGSITVKGTSKDMEVPVKLTYLPGKLGARNNGMEGDLLVLRADFTIHRDAFGINAGQNEDKVANEVELKLNVAGYHAK